MKVAALLISMASANHISLSSSDISVCAKTVVGFPPLVKQLLLDVISFKETSTLLLDLAMIASQVAEFKIKCQGHSIDEIEAFLLEHLNPEGKNCAMKIVQVGFSLAMFVSQITQGKFDPQGFADFLGGLAEEFPLMYDECSHAQIVF